MAVTLHTATELLGRVNPLLEESLLDMAAKAKKGIDVSGEEDRHQMLSLIASAATWWNPAQIKSALTYLNLFTHVR